VKIILKDFTAILCTKIHLLVLNEVMPSRIHSAAVPNPTHVNSFPIGFAADYCDRLRLAVPLGEIYLF
jgi:hypothetical protein